MKGKKFLAAFGLVLLIGVGTGAFFMGKSVAQDVTTWKIGRASCRERV